MSKINKIVETIREAGGPVAVARASQRSEHPVGIDAVFKWYRNGIPSEHWAMLMKLVDGLTVQDLFDINKLVVRPSKSRGRRRRRASGEPRAAA